VLRRWIRSSEKSDAYLLRRLASALGRRLAGRRYRELLRKIVVRLRRHAAHQGHAPDGKIPPGQLRKYGDEGDHRWPRSSHQTMGDQSNDDARTEFRNDGICLQ